MVKLLSTGRTDLLPRFISKKGRPFSAFLVRGADGKVGFEFAPRVGKVTAAARPKAAENLEKPAARAPLKSATKTTKTRAKTKTTKKPAVAARRKSAT